MKADIENRIKEYFTDIDSVRKILKKLDVPEEEKDRVIRCVLYLSVDDYDSLDSWVKTANIDRRDIYYFAEYDNCSERKWNFNIEFDKQNEYEYKET